MKDFHFTSEKEQQEIEQILQKRKKKIAKQQIIFLTIFIFLVCGFIIYGVRKMIYAEFDGYVVVHNVRFRASEDIFVHDIYKHNGDLIEPGDTMYSYVSMDWFHELGNINSESAIIVKDRDLKLQYGLAYQNLAVIRARMAEIKRQIEVEDHNIRFGLSNNVHKLNLERDYKEAEEELKAQQRKLNVLLKAIGEQKDEVLRLGAISGGDGGFSVQYVRDREKMKKWGLLHYVIAADSGLVTKNWISELSLVLRGEDVLESQNIDLRKDNVYVMAYITPNRAKYLNRGYKATIIVNDDIEYTATVVSMGARTEEIPEAYRNNLSKDHIAAIAVLKIDDGQKIPFWSVVNGLPVLVRFNKLEDETVAPDEYLQLFTPRGLIVPDSLKTLIK